jgi:hypothetical protein
MTTRDYPRFLTPGRAFRLFLDVCAASIETAALGVDWDRVGRKVCWGIVIFAVTYFVIRGFVSLHWGV